ncbi:serine hydrolase domain-containing protein [Aestuariibacter salexigens]|uniref:serine hydrolase domain-containing protein n=1 Tax=Aestuariibacter salexigens TaxID=226010 RepID=UPI00040114AA|nr:serine hydrolase domain-containing protein [Aestuariibacter salexigens]
MKFLRFTLLLLSVALLFSAAPNTYAAAASRAWFNDFAAEFTQSARKYNVPGFAMLMIDGDNPVQIVTWGKTHQGGANIDELTLFRLASVSKTFTAILMAKMVENKQVDWETSLTQLVPDYRFGPVDKPMRLRHVIGQSSGYMPNAYDNLIEANYSVKRVLNQLADLQPLCQPGQCYTYQNALFGVLEQYFSAQNTSYHRQLTEQLLQPLNMPTASVGKGALLASENWARPHIAIARNKWREGMVESDYYRFSPAAGVNASITDMAIWIDALLGRYPQVVSPDVIQQVTTPQVKTKRELNRRGWKAYLKDAHYGLGWRLYDFDGKPLYYHGGWVKGYRADVAVAPEHDAGFALLMNAESNLINTITAQFWHRYFRQVERRQLANAATSTSN